MRALLSKLKEREKEKLTKMRASVVLGVNTNTDL
jgi:hypothetical protein